MSNSDGRGYIRAKYSGKLEEENNSTTHSLHNGILDPAMLVRLFRHVLHDVCTDLLRMCYYRSDVVHLQSQPFE